MQSFVTANTGTLLWIGERHGDEFAASYDQCEQFASQIAWRPDIDAAIARPASDVRCVLLAQTNRLSIESNRLNRLAEIYPNAARLNLLGSMCEGMCRTAEPYFGSQRHYWHRSNQVLPSFLAHWRSGQSSESRQRSVCVVAADFSTAQSLLELAESVGVTTVWSRTAHSIAIRNIDSVWWDDSVARPAISRVWSQRTANFRSASGRVTHAWIASAPRSGGIRQALAGGIDIVVSKPCLIYPLIWMVGGEVSNHSAVSVANRRAA